MPLPDPRRSAAILIGTDVYDEPELADLPTVANNLQGLRSALTDTAAGGFLINNCLPILNPSSTRLISEQLLQVAEKAQDTLLVYIAGHGLPDMSSGELYLALRDTNIENLRFTALRYDDLRQLFLNSPRITAAKRIVILDCCYSGRVLPAMSEGQVGGMVDIDGVYIMTSTSENVRALAPLGERYTAFTGQLLNILNDGVPGGPELLTLDSIYHRLDSHHARPWTAAPAEGQQKPDWPPGAPTQQGVRRSRSGGGRSGWSANRTHIRRRHCVRHRCDGKHEGPPRLGEEPVGELQSGPAVHASYPGQTI